MCVTVWGSLKNGNGVMDLSNFSWLLLAGEQGADVLKFYTVLCQLLFVRGSKTKLGSRLPASIGGGTLVYKVIKSGFCQNVSKFFSSKYGPSWSINLSQIHLAAMKVPPQGFTGVRPWVRSKVLLVALAIRSPLDLLVGAPW